MADDNHYARCGFRVGLPGYLACTKPFGHTEAHENEPAPEPPNAANVATSTQFLDALRRSVHNDGPSEKMLAVLRSIEVCRMLGVTIGGKKIRDGISLPSEEAASRTYSDMVRAGWIR